MTERSGRGKSRKGREETQLTIVSQNKRSCFVRVENSPFQLWAGGSRGAIGQSTNITALFQAFIEWPKFEPIFIYINPARCRSKNKVSTDCRSMRWLSPCWNRVEALAQLVLQRTEQNRGRQHCARQKMRVTLKRHLGKNEDASAIRVLPPSCILDTLSTL